MEAYRAFKKVVPSIGEEKASWAGVRRSEWLFSLSCDPGCKSKKRKDGFLLKNKLEFAKQIVLESGDYLRLHLHDDLMISKRLGRQI